MLENEAQIIAIAETAATKAANEALQNLLMILGTDIKNPKGMLDLQKDFLYTRETREGKEEFIKKGKLTLIGAFIMATLALIVNGFFNWNPGQ